MTQRFYTYLLCVFVLSSCSNSAEEEENATAPVSIFYSTDTLLVLNSQTAFSGEPELENGGAKVTNFSLIGTIPTGISVDAKTGVIRATDDSPEGRYSLDLELENSAGKSSFTNVLQIIRRKVEFKNDLKTLFNTRCTPCHVFGVEGNWLLYNEAKSNIDTIILRSITNADMPPSSPLPQSEKDLILQWKVDGLLE
jgi:hypothetical protein